VDNKIIGQKPDGDQNFKYLWVALAILTLNSTCGSFLAPASAAVSTKGISSCCPLLSTMQFTRIF
jgi:hypothetical protein